MGLSIALFANQADAAAFIKFEGIDGEAQDRDHRGWSDVTSFSYGFDQPEAAAVGAARRRSGTQVAGFHFVMEVDKSSPKLAEAVALGRAIPRVVFHVTASYTDAGRVTYYAIELSNVLVTHYEVTGNGAAEQVPLADVVLSFEAIKVTYTERDAAGRIRGNTEFNYRVEGR